ncbi:hypothetical protein VE01_06783 [Pseudogymnoascus verrucosus]|uniref:Beta-xylosidase C-terminal Concanavalin A-like domain-containing protein n=1 Tax=Pseudogymnoascus verrucosus TaxID=342668 RepID=A0A1B8GJS8_9PEZI|nr:uncharacterized protein VE01_06783 [Pseudogymnoascus verrucosus]OBT96091.1 hypothetical protein VE01_06783 [Pseudogymnoascus verrucosus]
MISHPNHTRLSGSISTTICITSSFLTSSFLTFPSLTLYSSPNLTTWTLSSNVFNRPSQVSEFATLDTNADEGFWAATVRYHDGLLYVVVTYIDYDPKLKATYYLFTTLDPYDDTAWSASLQISNPPKTIDPDLFWDDDDGTLYIASEWGAMYPSTLTLTTSTSSSPAARIWNGTSNSNPEDPHIYKKASYHHLLIAEGSSGLNHSATIARSPSSIWGPYESYPGNPILTNRGTGGVLSDRWTCGFLSGWGWGDWWGAALATRSGSGFEVSLMGRETVMFPVSWLEGGWPVADPVRGEMSWWNLPLSASPPRHDEILVDGADIVNSTPARQYLETRSTTASPSHHPTPSPPPGQPKTLQRVPSSANLTANSAVRASDGLTFIARRQTATLFKFSVDFDFSPRREGEEAGDHGVYYPGTAC